MCDCRLPTQYYAPCRIIQWVLVNGRIDAEHLRACQLLKVCSLLLLLLLFW